MCVREHDCSLVRPRSENEGRTKSCSLSLSFSFPYVVDFVCPMWVSRVKGLRHLCSPFSLALFLSFSLSPIIPSFLSFNAMWQSPFFSLYSSSSLTLLFYFFVFLSLFSSWFTLSISFLFKSFLASPYAEILKRGSKTSLEFVLNLIIFSAFCAIWYFLLFYFTFSEVYSSYKSENPHKGLYKSAF